MKTRILSALLLIPVLWFTGCNEKVNEEPKELEIVFSQPETFELGEVKEISYTLPGAQPTSVESDEVPAGWTVQVLASENKIKVTNSNDYPEGGKDGTAQIVLKNDKDTKKFPLTLKSFNAVNENLVIEFTQPDVFYLGETKEVTYSFPKELPSTVEAEGVPAGWTVNVDALNRKLAITCNEEYPEGGKDGSATIVIKDSNGKHNKATLELKCKLLLTITFDQPEQFMPGDIKYISYTFPQLQPASITVDEVPAGWEMEVIEGESKIKITCDEEYPEGGKNGTAQIVLAKDGETRKFPVTLTCKGMAGMVLIKAGTFTMGSPITEYGRGEWEVPHQVTLTKDFWMSKTEVTCTQYCAFLNAAGLAADGSGNVYSSEPRKLLFKAYGGFSYNEITNSWSITSDMETLPVGYVSWAGARAYAKWVDSANGELPTEAQWEYAARAENGTKPFGVGTGTKLDRTMANIGLFVYDAERSPAAYYDPSEPKQLGTVCEVGSYEPNAWGLYDMHGNVSEWCLDLYDFTVPYPSDPVTDPLYAENDAPVACIRGGGYSDPGQEARSAARSGNTPSAIGEGTGFRIIVYAE